MSSHFPRANRAAESAVKIAERILRRPDIFLALMAYRSTPITATGVSPAELLIGRKMQTPSHPNKLKPKWPNLGKIKEKDVSFKARNRRNYDKRHGGKDLKPLKVGDKIREKNGWRENLGKVKLDSSEIRKRNRRHLLLIRGKEYGSQEREQDSAKDYRRWCNFFVKKIFWKKTDQNWHKDLQLTPTQMLKKINN